MGRLSLALAAMLLAGGPALGNSHDLFEDAVFHVLEVVEGSDGGEYGDAADTCGTAAIKFRPGDAWEGAVVPPLDLQDYYLLNVTAAHVGTTVTVAMMHHADPRDASAFQLRVHKPDCAVQPTRRDGGGVYYGCGASTGGPGNCGLKEKAEELSFEPASPGLYRVSVRFELVTVYVALPWTAAVGPALPEDVPTRPANCDPWCDRLHARIGYHLTSAAS